VRLKFRTYRLTSPIALPALTRLHLNSGLPFHTGAIESIGFFVRLGSLGSPAFS
jgi:hypothetical protein